MNNEQSTIRIEPRNAWHQVCRIRNRDKIESGGQSLVSNARLQDPLLLTNMRGLYNYVDVVSERLCWKDTEDGFRGV